MLFMRLYRRLGSARRSQETATGTGEAPKPGSGLVTFARIWWRRRRPATGKQRELHGSRLQFACVTTCTPKYNCKLLLYDDKAKRWQRSIIGEQHIAYPCVRSTCGHT